MASILTLKQDLYSSMPSYVHRYILTSICTTSEYSYDSSHLQCGPSHFYLPTFGYYSLASHMVFLTGHVSDQRSKPGAAESCCLMVAHTVSLPFHPWCVFSFTCMTVPHVLYVNHSPLYKEGPII